MGLKTVYVKFAIITCLFVTVTYVVFVVQPMYVRKNIRENFLETKRIDLQTNTNTTLPISKLLEAKVSAKMSENLVPQCDHILTNMTIGKWIPKSMMEKYKSQKNLWLQQELNLEYELQDFWVKRGIQMGFWRSDEKCGYRNFEHQPPNTSWPQVGSWCNARGKKPCCTDAFDGHCAEPSKKTCDCLSCVDLRKYIYADVGEWIVSDRRCLWKNYTAAEACHVIEKSQIHHIHFVGDSFSRNMFRAFAMIITGDTVSGAWHNNMSGEIKKLCTERQQFFWKECRATLYNISDTYYINKLCGNRGYAGFSATMQPFYNLRFSAQFYDLVVSKLGVPGSLIIVSIGFHMGCVSEREIEFYLGPAVDAIEQFYSKSPRKTSKDRFSGRWPQIMLSLPLTIGLLKPTAYLYLQNEYKCRKYSKEMREYAEKHNIFVLDFHSLTTLVHSFDGTHHGLAVNLMKNQILLNFIASLEKKR